VTAEKKSARRLDREIADALSRSRRSGAGLGKYRALPPDDSLGDPLYKYGSVYTGRLGSHWTIAADVPMADLAELCPVV
jgi:hypothetical protein